tara:strand:+ start:35439 stop:36413 length:975 start_codon:yes stop_codon:yes gene_type:complete
MSDEIEKLLDSGNLDDIDAVLSKFEEGEDAELDGAESGDTDAGEPLAADPPSQSAEPGKTDDQEPAAPAAEPAAPAAPIVRAKDGVHEIPFSVLEQERQQAAALRDQLNELTRRNELLQQQLTAADIKPRDLPEQVRFTPEQIAEFESYGEIGQAVSILAQQNEILLGKLKDADPPAAAEIEAQAKPEAAEQSNPLAGNPDTLRWANNDAHWSVVETVNAALDADPKWAGQSLESRIPEIVRRTKFALGEATDAAIDQAAAEAVEKSQSRQAPNSLTDVGGEIPGSTKSVVEQLESGDTSDVEAYIASQVARGKSVDEVLASLL